MSTGDRERPTPAHAPAPAAASPREGEANGLAQRLPGRAPERGPRPALNAPAASVEEEQGAVRLPHTVRAELEPRFDTDLTDVRVRTDSAVADQVGAQAFARGRLVSFAPGAWAPRTRAGRDLIAHEVAHVVIDRGRPPAMASQKAPAAGLFYQDVVDAENSSWGYHALAIRPIRELCQAVDQERTTEIEKAAKALDKVDIALLPPQLPSRETGGRLLARMMLIGASAQVPRVHSWLSSIPDLLRPRTVGGRRYFDTEAGQWDTTLSALRSTVDWVSAKGSARSVDAYLAMIPLLVRTRNDLPSDAVTEDRERLAAAGDPFPSFGMQSGPTLTISRYHRYLAELTRQSFAGAMAGVQAMLDLATADLVAGKGTEVLDALEARLGQFAALLPGASGSANTADRSSRMPEVAGTEIDETVWEHVKGKRAGQERLVQVDAFADQPGAELRRTVLEGYDVTMPFARPSRMLDPGLLLEFRTRQVLALRRIYGVTGPGGKPTPESIENKAALAKAAASGEPALRLNSDDDWRRFLVEKYRLHAATSTPAEAFDALVDLVQVYLGAFTTHSPMNIADFGDNQLTQNFPRALTGQLIHDCGVYALRIAYMLSRVREEPALKLEIRAVQMPAHIGLVITSSVADIGVYLAQNDKFTHYGSAALTTLRETWDVIDDAGGARPAAPHTAATDRQFLGELSADEFVPLTEMPFLMSDVPHLSGTSRDADTAALWAAYQKELKRQLFGKASRDSGSPQYQFQLRYLDVLEQSKRHYNQYAVLFWNGVAHPAWVATHQAIENAPVGTKFDEAVRTYLDWRPNATDGSLNTQFEAMPGSYAPVWAAVKQLNAELLAHPEVVAPGASRASSKRLFELWGREYMPGWWLEVKRHLDAAKNGHLTVPPYAAADQYLIPVD